MSRLRKTDHLCSSLKIGVPDSVGRHAEFLYKPNKAIKIDWNFYFSVQQ